jgi:hypothetical protein
MTNSVGDLLRVSRFPPWTLSHLANDRGIDDLSMEVSRPFQVIVNQTHAWSIRIVSLQANASSEVQQWLIPWHISSISSPMANELVMIKLLGKVSLRRFAHCSVLLECCICKHIYALSCARIPWFESSIPNLVWVCIPFCFIPRLKTGIIFVFWYLWGAGRFKTPNSLSKSKTGGILG